LEIGPAGATRTADGAANAGTAGEAAEALSGIAANTRELISVKAKSILQDMGISLLGVKCESSTVHQENAVGKVICAGSLRTLQHQHPCPCEIDRG
jgi:hypothetical protein